MSEHKRVVLLERLAPECLKYLKEDDLQVDLGVDWDERELVQRIPLYDALIVGSTASVSAEVLRAGRRLQVVGRTGVVIENVDVAEASRHGIVVACAPQCNVVSRAEQTVALLLACAQNLAQTDTDLKDGRWEGAGWAASSVEVRGKTLGFIGVDQSVPLVADGARALGMSVLAFDPLQADERSSQSSVKHVDNPGRIYGEADFIVVQLPASENTTGLIGAAEFAQMKDGVRVIGLAGEGVIDPVAWLRALEGGKVAASVVGIHAGEIAVGNPLLQAGNVILAAHLETSTRDAELRAGMDIVEQVSAVLRGEFASNAVNVSVVPGGNARDLMLHVGLCTQLGRLMQQLAASPVNAVQVTYGGSLEYYDTRILTLSVLGGLLCDSVDGTVNFVNAQSIADERGVSASETRQSGIPDFPMLITVSTTGPEGETSVSGTSLGPEHKPRLVKVFGEDLDIELASHMAFLRYVDVPGVGGAVGTMLGESGINIGHMSVGRGALGTEAVMGLTLDQPLSESRLDELVARCGLVRGKRIEL